MQKGPSTTTIFRIFSESEKYASRFYHQINFWTHFWARLDQASSEQVSKIKKMYVYLPKSCIEVPKTRWTIPKNRSGVISTPNFGNLTCTHPTFDTGFERVWSGAAQNRI